MTSTSRRGILTVPARHALTSAEHDALTQQSYVIPTWYGSVPELIDRNLVQDMGMVAGGITRRYALTADGQRMREVLAHDTAVRQLARLARDQHISGEDMADVAAAVDNEQEECIGVSIVFYLAFWAHCEQDNASGADVRQEVELALGW